MKSLKAAQENEKGLQQVTMHQKIGIKPFTALGLGLLAAMTIAYPAALHWFFYPAIYCIVRQSDFLLRLAGTIIAMLWFFPLFWFEYWFLGKRRRMQAAQAELERLQADSKPQ